MHPAGRITNSKAGSHNRTRKFGSPHLWQLLVARGWEWGETQLPGRRWCCLALRKYQLAIPVGFLGGLVAHAALLLAPTPTSMHPFAAICLAGGNHAGGQILQSHTDPVSAATSRQGKLIFMRWHWGAFGLPDTQLGQTIQTP